MNIIPEGNFSVGRHSVVVSINGYSIDIFKDATNQFYVNVEGLSIILGLTPLNLKEKYSITKEYYGVTEIRMFARQEYLKGNDFAWENLINQFFTSTILEKVFKGEVEITKGNISYQDWIKEVLENAEFSVPKVSHKLSEKNIQDRLSNQFNFTKEVFTPAGRIDLLGENILCEIKEASQWKHGLGQLCGYSQYYPAYDLYLCLFNVNKSTNIETIKQVCKEFDVIVVNDYFKLL